jgi:hypothetical protein
MAKVTALRLKAGVRDGKVVADGYMVLLHPETAPRTFFPTQGEITELLLVISELLGVVNDLSSIINDLFSAGTGRLRIYNYFCLEIKKL